MPFNLGRPLLDSVVNKSQELIKAKWGNTSSDQRPDLPGRVCPSCEELVRLTTDGFLVGHAHKQAWMYLKGRSLGTITDVKRRQSKFGCGNCKLILSLVAQSSSTSSDDGRTLHLVARPSNTKKGESLRVYANLIVDKRSCGRIFVLLDEEAWVKRLTLQQTNFIARLKKLSQESSLDIGLVPSWLHTCLTSHTHCNAKDFFGPQEPSNVTFVDVLEGKLVDSNTSSEYITLSYVWGCAPDTMFHTFKENVISRKSPGSLNRTDARIPKVIRDAMELVERLGKRFLWVDGFCITQDDEHHKSDQLGKMDAIYSQAFMTIVAASGKSAHDALPGIQPSSRKQATFAESGPGVKFVSGPPSPVHVWDTLPIESRAWCFQERLLSRRCLIFTELEVYFHCQETQMQEGLGEEIDIARLDMKEIQDDVDEKADGDRDLPSELSREELASLDSYSQRQIEYFTKTMEGLPHAISNMTRGLGGKDNVLALYARAKKKPDPDQDRFFELYLTYLLLVKEYTSRNITHRSDALNAFTSTTLALTRLGSTRFVAGLPELCFDFALMWILRSEQGALRTPNSESAKAALGFPTWSWVGCTGKVGFTLRWIWTTDTLPNFKAELGQITIEERGQHHAVQRSEFLQCPPENQIPKPPAVELLRPPINTPVLHLWAQVVDLKAFKAVDGKFICTHGMPEKSSIRGFVSSKATDWTAENWGPSITTMVRDLCEWEYYDYLDRKSVDGERDVSGLQLILLSRIKKFPVRYNTPQAITGWMRSKGKWGLAAQSWVTMNAMLVRWKTGNVAERITVGHLHEFDWQLAGPKWRYIRLV